VNSVVRQLEASGDSDIPSKQIGGTGDDTLKELDKVAYVRFASVYRNFREAKDFEEFVGGLVPRRRASVAALARGCPFRSRLTPDLGPAKNCVAEIRKSWVAGPSPAMTHLVPAMTHLVAGHDTFGGDPHPVAWAIFPGVMAGLGPATHDSPPATEFADGRGEPTHGETMTPQDHDHMRAALALARRGLGTTWPNLSVGWLSSSVTAASWGEAPPLPGGRPHCRNRRARHRGRARRAVPPPMSRWSPAATGGRSPPCTEALIAAGNSACRRLPRPDPDSRVNGKGLARLREAGTEVQTGLLEDEARETLIGFHHRITLAAPW